MLKRQAKSRNAGRSNAQYTSDLQTHSCHALMPVHLSRPMPVLIRAYVRGLAEFIGADPVCAYSVC